MVFFHSPSRTPQQLTSGQQLLQTFSLADRVTELLSEAAPRLTSDWSFQVHQVEMEGVVRGIQADMTKLSKSHSHTSNTVSKLLDKSRKLSVTMKEVKNGVTLLVQAHSSPVRHTHTHVSAGS